MVGNKNYLIPDGVSGASIHRAIAFNETRLTNTWSDYWTYAMSKTSISLSATFENVTLNAAFTQTKGYINQLTKNGTRAFGYNGAVYLTFGLQFRGTRRPALDDDFVDNVKGLPAQYDAAKYRRFIKAWGTHYFINARYGCEYNVTVSADKSFQEKKGSKWVQNELDLNIQFNEIKLGIKTDKLVNRSMLDGSFADGAKVDANARGGDESKFVLGKDFDGWLASCATLKTPILKYSEVEPITEVIDNPTIKANVRRAIIDYAKNPRK